MKLTFVDLEKIKNKTVIINAQIRNIMISGTYGGKNED